MASILVVDDEEGIRSFLAEALESDGHEVWRAANASVALDVLRERVFDLVLTDLKMPGMDGMDLLAKVREEQPETEVVVLTAHGSVTTAVEAMRRGAFDFLEKPISSPGELRLLAARALERRRLRTFEEGAARAAGDGPRLTFGDEAMVPIVQALTKVARTEATVLLAGESGTGKEVAARYIHAESPRRAGPFMAINCAVLSGSLLESELFGHERGAFTDAHERRRGRIELAAGGTFFLDEVGELTPALQGKLLRVLQERVFERVGGQCTLDANVRWIAATNRDLAAMIAAGAFREDLYHRLAVFPVRLPPLRERRSDIVPIARELLRQIGAELGRTDLVLSKTLLSTLREAHWPGNVRELRNQLERAAILADGKTIEPAHLYVDATLQQRPPPPTTLEEIERQAIRTALEAVDGNRRLAAERLGIGLRTLYERLKRYDEG